MTALSRRLLYFPIIHSLEDLGVAGAKALSARSEAQAMNQKQIIDDFWGKVEEAVAGLDLNFTQVRLYQDGLPVCGHESEIVMQLVATGSRNHRLLHALMRRGGALTGTESGELLVEEYELLKQTLLPGTETEPCQQLADALLRRRDAYMVERIHETLLPGETGILFIGLMHDLAHRLTQRDIEVSFPIGRPTIRA